MEKREEDRQRLLRQLKHKELRSDLPGKFYDEWCRFCGAEIVFYTKIVTGKGTWQALDPDTYKPHSLKCPRRPLDE
jgi:hypothetical protein